MKDVNYGRKTIIGFRYSLAATNEFIYFNVFSLNKLKKEFKREC